VKIAVLALVLIGCTAAPAPTPPSSVPIVLQSCPSGTMAPPAPPAPRAIPVLLAWTDGVALALRQTEFARQECAARLHQLNAWIAEHLPEAVEVTNP